ncbi:MAG: hypothetical protein IGR93_02135 [Hydrococcus sp. C42_A2020_068]|nr:hypothetical protein [Hydrococcus sp. C42_A2020_068]
MLELHGLRSQPSKLIGNLSQQNLSVASVTDKIPAVIRNFTLTGIYVIAVCKRYINVCYRTTSSEDL